MFQGFAKGRRKFTCVILTEGIRREQGERLPHDVRLQLGRPADVTGPAELFYRQVGDDTISLQVRVEAADPEAARHQAEQRLGEVFAGLNLFQCG